MLYIAVSIAHACPYCIHSHTAAARAKGMSEAEYVELVAIVGMAAETNRLVTALGVPVDGNSDAAAALLRTRRARSPAPGIPRRERRFQPGPGGPAPWPAREVVAANTTSPSHGRMGRPQRQRNAVLRHDGDALHLRLVEARRRWRRWRSSCSMGGPPFIPCQLERRPGRASPARRGRRIRRRAFKMGRRQKCGPEPRVARPTALTATSAPIQKAARG